LPWHVVEEGECIASLADHYGLLDTTIWDAPENGDLKALRKDPNVLAKGDAVFIPAPNSTAKKVAGDTRHRFRVKTAPVEFRLRLVDGDKPLAGVDYTLAVDGRLYPEGGAQTDGDGWVVQKVPASAEKGTLSLPKLGRRFEIRIGHLEPVEVEAGVRARLRNLGFLTAQDDAALREALAAFQAAHALDATGQPDDPTRAKLREAHGS